MARLSSGVVTNVVELEEDDAIRNLLHNFKISRTVTASKSNDKQDIDKSIKGYTAALSDREIIAVSKDTSRNVQAVAGLKSSRVLLA